VGNIEAHINSRGDRGWAIRGVLYTWESHTTQSQSVEGASAFWWHLLAHSNANWEAFASHDLITIQLLVPNSLWRDPKWYSSNPPLLRKTRWKLLMVFIPSSDSSLGRTLKADWRWEKQEGRFSSTIASSSSNLWFEF
jgi:hypothetical protein